MKTMAQITYDNKVALNENPNVADINKVTDDDMNEIKTTINTNTPVGCINLYAGSTAPTGWLICDGSAVSRTTYANLFSVIGTTYGAGDGSTTFNVPNLKGKVPVGLDLNDTDFDTLGETGGEKTHTLIPDEMPSHRHNLSANYTANTAHGHYQNDSYVATGIPPGQAGGTAGTPYMTNAGGDGAHNNLQPYIVMNYIISY